MEERGSYGCAMVGAFSSGDLLFRKLISQPQTVDAAEHFAVVSVGCWRTLLRDLIESVRETLGVS